MINKKGISTKMLALQFKDPSLLYNRYMPFLGHNGPFVPIDDVLPLDEDILLTVEIADYPERFLPTKVAQINPACTLAHHPKDIGLAFSEHEGYQQAKNLIEAGLGPCLRNDRTTFTL